MKKRAAIFLACLMTSAVVVLSGCSSNTKMDSAAFSDEETAIAEAMTDVYAKFSLPTEGSYVVKLITYQKGQKKSESEMRDVTGVKDNNTLYISGVNSSGLDYTWTITAPGGRLTYPTPYYTVKEGETMIRVTDTGETSFDLNDGKEHLLYYVAYKSGQDSSTISEAPFHEWSDQADQNSVIGQFDCVYLITIAQQTE